MISTRKRNRLVGRPFIVDAVGEVLEVAMRLQLVFVVVIVLAITALAPAAAYAQGAIVGTANDTSTAALPGVTVEARSPVLIEVSRTTVLTRKGSTE